MTPEEEKKVLKAAETINDLYSAVLIIVIICLIFGLGQCIIN